MSDTLGDRMKLYEGMEAGRRLMPLLPALARIDGRAFHSFTRGMDRPFDARFSACMVDTTLALVRDTGACMGYTQSDEITLAWHSRTTQSQIWFDGRVAKMTSQLAAQATLIFYRLVLDRMPEYAVRLPTFDARVWNVPSRAEGANVFLWREWDATKNSVNMAASAYYSHKALIGRNSPQKHDMLLAKGVNWNDYPPLFKRGAYVQRRTVVKPFSADELDRLPPKHEARTNPALVVERSVCSVLDMPPLGSVTNREAVIFDGALPELETAHLDSVIACLEDDAAFLRNQIADSEIATNMEKAAKLLRAPRGEDERRRSALTLPRGNAVADPDHGAV
ncbi:MAG: tRNA(His) guanylyltransferase Thg1 family protein [Betaproteobacteria bacterium]|nr:tRNA(His) guanylyltransferase Thg1 family protein [Betaproteobacteria bacterium]